jgi:hypothetical protein
MKYSIVWHLATFDSKFEIFVSFSFHLHHLKLSATIKYSYEESEYYFSDTV